MANNGVWYAARYTENWRRDRRRGYSFADWGLEPFETRAECERDFHGCRVVYSRELGGWMPALNGLSAAATAWDWTAEEAIAQVIEAAESTHYSSFPYRYLVVFPCDIVGMGPDGEDLVRPTGRAIIIDRG